MLLRALETLIYHFQKQLSTKISSPRRYAICSIWRKRTTICVDASFCAQFGGELRDPVYRCLKAVELEHLASKTFEVHGGQVPYNLAC